MEDEIFINDAEISKKDLEFKVLRASVKIEIGPSKFGSGFFIKFKKNNNKKFYCLMTNQHVIKPEMIEKKQKIKILYDNEEKSLIFKLDQEDRFIKYFMDSLQIDLTAIQILEKDNIEDKYFLEPYDNYKKGCQFKGKTISVVQYPLGGKLSMSTGIIKRNNDITIIHTASTLRGSSGGPIVLKEDDKVLGIHRGGNEHKQQNYGLFIGPVIDDKKNLKEMDLEMIFTKMEISNIWEIL